MKTNKNTKKNGILIVLLLALVFSSFLPALCAREQNPAYLMASESRDATESPNDPAAEQTEAPAAPSEQPEGDTGDSSSTKPGEPSDEPQGESEEASSDQIDKPTDKSEETSGPSEETSSENTDPSPGESKSREKSDHENSDPGEGTGEPAESEAETANSRPAQDFGSLPAILLNPDPSFLDDNHPYRPILFAAGDKGSFGGRSLADSILVYALPGTPWTEIMAALPQVRQVNDLAFIKAPVCPAFVTSASLAEGPYRLMGWDPALPAGDLPEDFLQEEPFTAVWEKDYQAIRYRASLQVNLETRGLDLAGIPDLKAQDGTVYLPLLTYDRAGEPVIDPYLSEEGFYLPLNPLSYRPARRQGLAYSKLTGRKPAPLYESALPVTGESHPRLRPFGLPLAADRAFSAGADISHSLDVSALSHPLLYVWMGDLETYEATREALSLGDNLGPESGTESAVGREERLAAPARITDRDPGLSVSYYLDALEATADRDTSLSAPPGPDPAYFAGLQELDLPAAYAENGSLIYDYLLNVHIQQVASTKLTVRWLEPGEADLPEDLPATPLAADLPLADPSFTEEEPLIEPNQDLFLPLSFETVSRNKILSAEDDLSLQAGNLSCQAEGEPYQDLPVFRPEDLYFEADEARGLYRLDLLPLEDQSLSLYDLFGDPDDPLNPHLAHAQLLRAQNLMQDQEDLPRLLLGGVSSGILEIPLPETQDQNTDVAADTDVDAAANANADAHDDADAVAAEPQPRRLYRFEISYDPLDGALVEFIRLAGGAENSYAATPFQQHSEFVDTDGDGVPDTQEIEDKTDPNNPREYRPPRPIVTQLVENKVEFGRLGIIKPGTLGREGDVLAESHDGGETIYVRLEDIPKYSKGWGNYFLGTAPKIRYKDENGEDLTWDTAASPIIVALIRWSEEDGTNNENRLFIKDTTISGTFAENRGQYYKPSLSFPLGGLSTILRVGPEISDSGRKKLGDTRTANDLKDGKFRMEVCRVEGDYHNLDENSTLRFVAYPPEWDIGEDKLFGGNDQRRKRARAEELRALGTIVHIISDYSWVEPRARLIKAEDSAAINQDEVFDGGELIAVNIPLIDQTNLDDDPYQVKLVTTKGSLPASFELDKIVDPQEDDADDAYVFITTPEGYETKRILQATVRDKNGKEDVIDLTIQVEDEQIEAMGADRDLIRALDPKKSEGAEISLKNDPNKKGKQHSFSIPLQATYSSKVTVEWQGKVPPKAKQKDLIAGLRYPNGQGKGSERNTTGNGAEFKFCLPEVDPEAESKKASITLMKDTSYLLDNNQATDIRYDRDWLASDSTGAVEILSLEVTNAETKGGENKYIAEKNGRIKIDNIIYEVEKEYNPYEGLTVTLQETGPPPTGLEMTRQKEVPALVISGLVLGLFLVLRRKAK